MFGDAADKGMFESRAAMRGSDDEINVWLARCSADFVDCVTRESFGLNGHTAQKIHLFECVHFLSGRFFHRLDQPGETDTGAVNEHVICIRDRSRERDGAWHQASLPKTPRTPPGECTLREIYRNQDGTDSECFGARFRSSFPLPRDKHRARGAADDSFRCAPQEKMLQAAMATRRKDDQIGSNLAGQTDNLLVRPATANVTILRTKRLHTFSMNASQFLVKTFDRLG